eukprot:Nk52_evm28s367 gene=Nk52_evmTU28s367
MASRILVILLIALTSTSASLVCGLPVATLPDQMMGVSSSGDGSNSQATILSQFTQMDRPYPSAGTSSDAEWDIFMVMDSAIANSNFASMHAAPQTYDMLRNLYYKDCDTPVSDWYYPNGTCFIVNVTLSSPVLQLDTDGETLDLVMNATAGECILAEPGVNNTIDLTGAQFMFDVALSQVELTAENSTMVFVNTTGSTCSVQSSNITNPNFASAINEEMASAFQNTSTENTYPFVTYNQTIGEDMNAMLVPTYFEMEVFTSEYGDTYVAFFIMTQGRQAPSSKYLDSGLLYMAEGSNVFMLVSNNMVATEVIPTSMNSNFTYTVENSTSSSGYGYKTLSGSYETGIEFEATKSASQEWGSCDLGSTVTYDVDLKTFSVKSIGSTPTSDVIITGLDQSFQFGWCSTNGLPEQTTSTLAYTVTSTYTANGGNVVGNIAVSNSNNFPTSGGAAGAITGTTGEGSAQDVLKDSTSSINAALDGSLVSTVFNIYADEQVLFGPVEGFNVTGVYFMYDMVIFGNVNI